LDPHGNKAEVIRTYNESSSIVGITIRWVEY